MSYYKPQSRIGIYLNRDHMTRVYWQAEVQARWRICRIFWRERDWLMEKLGVKQLEEMGYFEFQEYASRTTKA